MALSHPWAAHGRECRDVGFLVTKEKGRGLHSTADSSLPGKGQQDKDFSAQV